MAKVAIGNPQTEIIDPPPYEVDITIYKDEEFRPYVKAGFTGIAYYRGDSLLVSDSWEKAVYHRKVLCRIGELGLSPTGTVACISMGTGIMPTILAMAPWAAFDVYELYQEIIDDVAARVPSAAAKWTAIQGDWRNTLTGTYDLIIVDTGEVLDETEKDDIKSHKSGSGIVFFIPATGITDDISEE